MRITKAVLNAQVENLNYYTKRSEGEKYYVGEECGYTNLFLECGSGRETISWGNTKRELRISRPTQEIASVTTMAITVVKTV